MLELRHVRHRYDGRVVLDLERFTVPGGALLAIVGHNGSGKSTLLRLLALLESPSEGTVLLDGVAVPRRVTPALRRRVTLVEQRPLLLRGTVRDNLGFGLRARGVGRTAVDRIVQETAEKFALGSLLSRDRRELSDGETQRVAVARAVALKPDVLLLDEPASSADRAAVAALFRALAVERATRPLAVCIASHQLEDAYRWADDIRALAEGRLSPVTPENLFRVELPAGGDGALKHVRIAAVEIAVATERTGPAVIAVSPTDIFVSREVQPSSARNVLAGRVTRVASQRPGLVHVTADVGVELVAVVTAEAAGGGAGGGGTLDLTPGAPVVFAFKASAVRVF